MPSMVINGVPARSRATQRTERMIVDEEVTRCSHCGCSTALLKNLPDGRRYERCPHCGQTYCVQDANEPEDDDDPVVHGGDPGDIEVVDTHTGRVVGMTNAGLDNLLGELNGEMPEASQEDLDHLFGIKRSDYPDFGSF